MKACEKSLKWKAKWSTEFKKKRGEKKKQSDSDIRAIVNLRFGQ